MAKGPKDFESRRKVEIAELEKIIDQWLNEHDEEGDIHIPLDKLPRLKLNLYRIQQLYIKAGWKTVDIHEISKKDYLRLSVNDYSPDWGDK